MEETNSTNPFGYSDRMIQEMEKVAQEGAMYEELLSQQNKGQKVFITDVAISKIPYVEYRGIPVNECQKLYELEKLLLALSKENNDSNEIAITYRLYREPEEEEIDRISIVYGSDKEVELGADTKTYHLLCSKMMAVIVMHNHPACTGLSLYDIAFFMNNPSVLLLIMVTNKGELHYIQKNDNYISAHLARLYLKSCADVCPDSVDEKNRIHFGKMTSEEMYEAAKLWLKNSQRYGIEFKHVLGNERKEYDERNGIKKETADDIKRKLGW